MPAEASDSIEDALAAIGRLGFDPPPRILITGSLYLAGEVLARERHGLPASADQKPPLDRMVPVPPREACTADAWTCFGGAGSAIMRNAKAGRAGIVGSDWRVTPRT